MLFPRFPTFDLFFSGFGKTHKFHEKFREKIPHENTKREYRRSDGIGGALSQQAIVHFSMERGIRIMN
jgi:hypothetical protein